MTIKFKYLNYYIVYQGVSNIKGFITGYLDSQWISFTNAEGGTHSFKRITGCSIEIKA